MRPKNFLVDSGDYREPFAVYGIQAAEDEGGGTTTSPVLKFATYGRLTPITSDKRWQSFRLTEQLTWEVETRWDDDLKTDNVLIFEGRYLKVVAIIDLEYRQRKMLLGCIETANPLP